MFYANWETPYSAMCFLLMLMSWLIYYTMIGNTVNPAQSYVLRKAVGGD